MHTAQPLASRALRNIALRVALVVCAATALGYWHALERFRAAAIDALGQTVKLRAERESELFQLAEDNLALLAERYVAALAAPPRADLGEEFDRRYRRWEDGAIRHRPEGFDRSRTAGAYASRNLALDDALRHRLITQQDLTTRYGRAWQARLANTYIASLDGVFATFMPQADWASLAPPEIERGLQDYPWVAAAVPANNPARGPAWTGVYLDDIAAIGGAAKAHFITVVQPIDVDGRFAHYVGADLTIDAILERNAEPLTAGAWNLIFTQTGQLIAHPEIADAIIERDGDFDIVRDGDPALQALWQAVSSASSPHGVVEVGDHYVGHARLAGPGWHFVSVLPRQQVTGPARDVGWVILLLGALSLVLELLIFRAVLRRWVTRPLGALATATGRLAGGDWSVRLPSGHGRELEQVAQSFNAMTAALAERDAQMHQYAATLEERVALRTAEWRALFDASPVAIARLVDRRVADANPAAAELFGYTSQQMAGRSVRALYASDAAFDAAGKALYRALESGPLRRHELELVRADGSRFWAMISAARVDPDAPGLGIVVLVEDISERKRREQQDAHRAMHDPVTGLPNRYLMRAHLEQRLLAARRTHTLAALLFVDLDRFKQINDCHGHEAGDAVLRICAERLSRCLRSSDVVARWGGDEFLVLLGEGTTAVDPDETARRIVFGLTVPVRWQDQRLSVGVSVGIALGPVDGDDASRLIARADAAMYAAKQAGGNRWRHAEPSADTSGA